jgi:hypothetical protein
MTCGFEWISCLVIAAKQCTKYLAGRPRIDVGRGGEDGILERSSGNGDIFARRGGDRDGGTLIAFGESMRNHTAVRGAYLTKMSVACR